MSNKRTQVFHGKAIRLVLLLLLISKLVAAQGLELKLSQKSDFVPSATSPREQLIEVAQHYRIPMGIEWMNQSDSNGPSELTPQPSVRDMIHSILREIPGYKVEVRHGIVNISCAAFIYDARNFLNIRIADYQANRENLFGAEALLRSNIHRTLHPELYAIGSNGGYGYGVPRDDGFDVKNISLSRKNATVREILNDIVEQNGNALWIVDLEPSKTMKDKPFFAQSASGMQVDFIWRTMPLEKPLSKQ